MGVLRAIVIPLVAAWTLCVASVHSAAQDAPPAPPPPQIVKSADGTASVTIPGDWKQDKSDAPPAKHLINLDAFTADKVLIQLWVSDAEAGEISELTATVSWAASQRVGAAGAEVRFAATPFPHVITVERGGSEPVVRVYRYLLAGRSMLRLQCAFKAASADALLPAVLQMLGSYASGPRDNLPPPAGYVRSTKPGIECWSAPGVKPADVARAQAFTAAGFAAVEKRYGGARATGVMTPRLFVHADRGGCDAAPDAGRESETGFCVSVAAATIHLYPFDEKDSRVCGLAARMITVCAIANMLGGAAPDWLTVGAGVLAYAETYAGKPHPALPHSLKQLDRPGDLDTLATLSTMDHGKVAGPRAIDATAHVLFLRDGPKEYRKALRSFLDLLAKTSDPEQAMKPLLELDQAKLAADARKYLNEKTKWDSSK